MQCHIVQSSLRVVGWLFFILIIMIPTKNVRTPCGKPHLLALLCSLSSLSAYAQTATPEDTDVTPVVIIGSRFPSAPDLAPTGATVITAADIHNAGIDNANEAIRKLAGVYGRQNFYGTQDFDLDMNGFGANSANNLVILVDGVRLSENEMNVAVLSSIPVDSIARIEIMKSGSSVLYGDGATGGVINVITKQLGPTPATGSVTAGLGQFNDHTGRVFVTRGWDDINVSLNVSDEKSDGYRVNSATVQKNASGTVTWYGTDMRAGLRFDIAHQDGGLSGPLTLAQFEQNPHQSSTPLDNASTDINRYTAFFDRTLGSWQFLTELSTRDRTVQGNYVSIDSYSTYSGRQTEFTPRVRNETVLDGIRNEFVMGLDLMNWNRQTTASYSMAYATQKSQAIYFRDEAKFGDARIALGARHELFDKASNDPVAYSTDTYNVKQNVNAWELQGSYAFVPAASGFAKIGQSYRVANVDDNGYTLIPNTPLLPQLSHDVEVGAILGGAGQQLTARVFRHDLTDEIYYNPLLNGGYGANTNLDPTRRQGASLEASYRLSQQFTMMAQAQHVNAKFTAGSNEGKQLTLVPENTVSAHLNWLSGDGRSAYLGGQWVDSQRYGDDFNNSCSALIPSHATLDGRYAQTFGAWELAVSGSNLTDKHYFTNGYYCTASIYPDDGRQMKATLRYSF